MKVWNAIKVIATCIVIDVLILSVVLVSLMAVMWGSNQWVQRSAAQFIYESPDDVEPRSVAIVLGARVYSDGTPSEALRDRLETALNLYRAGKVSRILVSGDHGRRGYDEVNAMQAWLVDRGVPVEDVFLDHAGFRTFDTMERAAQIFEVEEAIICTQRFHLSRAVFLARRSGIDAVGVVADQRNYARARQDARREFLARFRAVLDSLSPFSAPHHLGESIPIDGDARLTHDDRTRRE